MRLKNDRYSHPFMGKKHYEYHCVSDGADSYFLCRRSETAELIKKAEQERDNILNELKTFYTGNIGIRIYTADHVEGASIAGDLTVNGEICRKYDPVDLCFLELNELMLKRMIELGISSRREEEQQ